MPQTMPDTEQPQVYYHSYGGSNVAIIPNCEEAHRALLDAGLISDDDTEPSGGYPHVSCNYPTSTNRSWAEDHYNKVMDAISGFTMGPLHPQAHNPYPVGSREVYP